MTATGVPGHLTQGSATRGGIGESTLRPDGTLKVTGEFAYASDMWHEDMLWGHTLRSPHAHARIVSVDTGEALAQAGVYAVLTHDDLPAEVKNYGLEIQDTPALAHGRVRHHGGEVVIGDGSPGPVGLRLRAMLTDIQRGAAPDTHSWMRTLVPA